MLPFPPTVNFLSEIADSSETGLLKEELLDNNDLVPFNLAQTLLLNLNLFKFLDCIDNDHADGDSNTIEVVQRFLSKYGTEKSKVQYPLPFLRDCTSLVILTPAFAFGSTLDDEYWSQIGFRIEDRFKVSFEDLDFPEAAQSPQNVLRVLAEACQDLVSSLCDPRSEGAICYAGESVVFNTPAFQLTFGTAHGLRTFIQKYVPAVTRAIRERLLPMRQQWNS